MSGFVTRAFPICLLGFVSLSMAGGSRVWFSSRADGSDEVDRYSGMESCLYLIVETRELPPGVHAKATLVTKPSSPTDIPEIETGVLTRMNESLYAAAVFVDRTGSYAPGDDKLHLEFGDEITGSYQDPIDAEVFAEGSVGFGFYPALGASADPR